MRPRSANISEFGKQASKLIQHSPAKLGTGPFMRFYIELAVALLIVSFIVLLISTAWLERQRIRDFVPAPPETIIGGSPYFVAVNEAAGRLGFLFAGLFVQDRASRIYQARLALWISADGLTLVRIAGGKTAGANIKRTMLTSIVEPNRILETSDEFSASDLSGLTDRKLVLNAHLDELFARHQERLARYPDPKRAFSTDGALVALEEMAMMRATQLERLGLGKFVNPDRTVWRHTLKGAIQFFFKGFRAQLAEGEKQTDRLDIKRPGKK